MADFKPNYSDLRRVGCFNFGTLEYKFGIIEKRLKTISLIMPKSHCRKYAGPLSVKIDCLYKSSWTLSDA